MQEVLKMLEALNVRFPATGRRWSRTAIPFGTSGPTPTRWQGMA